MLLKTAHKYAHVSGIPFDDVMSAAHFVFMRAYNHNYRPKPGTKPAKFSSRLYNSLNWELKDYINEERPHRNHLEVDEELIGASEGDANFRVALESELSEDARTIVALVLETPDDITEMMRWDRVKSRKGFLRTLREHLQDVGWSTKRIVESFDELREAFKS